MSARRPLSPLDRCPGGSYPHPFPVMTFDYLVVGSGLTGAAIARGLADAGRAVLVVDRRSHFGGNVHDHTHPSGIRVHTYGPHYFRTVSEEIWAFVNRFGTFYPYEAKVLSHVAGTHESWPVGQSYIRRTVGEAWRPERTGPPGNFEEAALSLMPRAIYEQFVKEYNEKQWGVPATQLEAGLCKRFDVRADDDPRLTPQAKYQGLPREGYAALMERMLEGIPVVLNFDYLRARETFAARRRTIFTGPIDEFFNFRLGRLHYRAQRRETAYLPEVDCAQPGAQVNEPRHAGGPHIRTLEWKHLMEPELARRIRGTVLTRETAWSPEDPNLYEYPFPDAANQALYRQYRTLADALPEVLICGRLGDYRYYDMDHALGRALRLSARLLQEEAA